MRTNIQTWYQKIPIARANILRLAKTFNYLGNAENRNGTARPPEAEQAVKTVNSYSRQNPIWSLRREVAYLGILYSTIQNILQTLGHMFLYTVKRVN